MNYQELKGEIQKKYTGNERIIELLSGDDDQFQCFNNSVLLNEFTITNKKRQLKVVAKIFCNRHRGNAVTVEIHDIATLDFFEVYVIPHNGTFNNIISAILNRLPKKMLLMWLMRVVQETTLCLVSSVRTNDYTRLNPVDYKWIISTDLIVLYELTQQGLDNMKIMNSNMLCNGTKEDYEEEWSRWSKPGTILIVGHGCATFQGISLNVTMDDLKPIFQVYNDILGRYLINL